MKVYNMAHCLPRPNPVIEWANPPAYTPLDFLWLQAHKSEPALPPLPEPLTDAEFEALADQLADEWLAYVGTPVPSLSDDVISCADIYEEPS